MKRVRWRMGGTVSSEQYSVNSIQWVSRSVGQLRFLTDLLTYCLLFTDYCLLFTDYCLLFTVYCLLFTTYGFFGIADTAP